MSDRVLLNTNLWIYLYSKEPANKYESVSTLFLSHIKSLVLSTQVLGELYNVLTKKKLQTQEQAREIVSQLIDSFDISEINERHVASAMDVNARYKYSYWDSLLISTALISDCSILYSEDMQHNQLIENKLRIINPFETQS